MRKTVTVLGIFLAMAMLVSGCATGKIDLLKKEIQGVKRTAAGLKEKVKKVEKAVTYLDDRLTEVETAGIAPTESAMVVPVPVKRTVLKPAETTKFAKDAEPKPKFPAPAPPEVKSPKAKSLEFWLAQLAIQVDAHDKRLNAHDRKFSDLQRRIAEAEDETKPLYLWTQSFATDSSKLTSKNEKKLDGLALELLKGTLKVEEKVEGHADPRGKEEDNQKLSKERAQSCIDHLLTKLGPDNDVAWEAGTKWKDYFVAMATGETSRYGNHKYNRRVRFQKRK